MKKIIPLCIVVIMSLQLSAQANKTGTLGDLKRGQGQMQQQQQYQTATLKSAARLFGEKNDLTTVIMVLPAGSTVQVLDAADSSYFHVTFEDNEGYILKRQAVIDKTPAKINDNNNNASQQSGQVDNQQEQQNSRSRFSILEEKYGTGIAARINSGKIWKGMTPEMVKDSWGSPQRINRIVNGNTMNEQWTYKNTVLYFRDNSLVEWGPLRK